MWNYPTLESFYRDYPNHIAFFHQDYESFDGYNKENGCPLVTYTAKEILDSISCVTEINESDIIELLS